jgi:hypothetical protein
VTLNSGDAPVAPRRPRPIDLLAVRGFVVALLALLAGYMFLGRGFAHLGIPPVYVGEVVLGVGLLATAFAVARVRLRIARSWIAVLLVLFMVVGAARTIPYLERYGIDALRDAVLWGYGAFGLFIFVLADRAWLLGTKRLYGAVIPIFAVWLPIAWIAFSSYQQFIPLAPGGLPVLFFKNQDMAVHAVGAIAFLVLATRVATDRVQFAWRTAVALPLAWAVYITGSISRGAVASVLAGLAVLVVLARRSPTWVPVLIAGMVIAAAAATGTLPGSAPPGPLPGSAPPGPSQTRPEPSPTGEPTPVPTPIPTPTDGRELSPNQWWENLLSVIGTSSDPNLEGTKQFRLAWWTKIINYTVFGPYFWDGKGFGINLADDDGFQPTADHSLRAPHNSHFTVLARMGVPGFVLWLLLQGAFGIQLLTSVFAHRRSGDAALASVGGWILVYWTAMMVDTSFDPYLEGPQGGIWFWTLFGLGLVVIRHAPRLQRR